MGRMCKVSRAPHTAQCLHSSAMGFNPLHQQGLFMFSSLETYHWLICTRPWVRCSGLLNLVLRCTPVISAPSRWKQED